MMSLQIPVKAAGMVKYLLNQPAATREAYDGDAFYTTGDIARQEGEDYFILGRASIDIIKSVGHKISALEIEREMQGLNCVSEVSVVGVEDEKFGQRVVAAVILQGGAGDLHIDRLRGDLRSRLAGYKLQTLLYVAKELLKTAMGKAQKVLVREVFEGTGKGEASVQRWERRMCRNMQALQARL